MSKRLKVGEHVRVVASMDSTGGGAWRVGMEGHVVSVDADEDCVRVAPVDGDAHVWFERDELARVDDPSRRELLAGAAWRAGYAAGARVALRAAVDSGTTGGDLAAAIMDATRSPGLKS